MVTPGGADVRRVTIYLATGNSIVAELATQAVTALQRAFTTPDARVVAVPDPYGGQILISKNHITHIRIPVTTARQAPA